MLGFAPQSAGLIITLGFGTGGTAPVTPVVVTPSVGGTRKRGDKGVRVKRQRIILKLEGKEYELSSLKEVIALIKAAKKDVPALASVKAAEIVRSGQRIGEAKQEEPAIEVVSAPSSVREIIDDRLAEMERLYWTRVAAQVKALEDDEDDAWLML